MFTYTEEKKFTKEQVQKLFLSVGWISGKYPERLYKAQIHYVLVDPAYQGKGIAGKMIEYVKEKYKDFMYIDGMLEDKDNVPFYQKYGFSVMENGAAIQICNYDNAY
ncbi:GNAT family N-acetyltransferase [Lachnospiraceae bacterium AM26-1LB]|jgi:GNAT superfamily N-acetyltransferase|nr:GNAT family N-acetyltransferase [Lachnospiraceae bacterium AM26-1LB]